MTTPDNDPSPRRLFLVDGSGFIFRAFYAIRRLSTSGGVPTNAVYGFAQMMQKLMRDERPTHVAVVFDTKEPTFRHAIDPAYKANRTEPPDDLIPQFEIIRKLVDAYGWRRLEMPGFEADDIIATLADEARGKGYEVVLVSSDKDLCQLLAEGVTMLDTMKDRVTTHRDLAERFGGGPEVVVDFLAMAGDTSDNVPGLPGVGEKTAAKLIAQFGSLDAVLARADEIPGKLGEKIRDNKDKALLSRQLVAIKRDLPIDLALDELRVAEPDKETLRAFFTEYELSSLLRAIDDAAPPAPAKAAASAVSREKYHLVLAEPDLAAMIDRLAKAGRFAFDLETTSPEPMRARIVGLSFCCGDDDAYYVPVAHHYLGVPKQLSPDFVLDRLRALMADAKARKIGQNIKYDWIVLANAGVEVAGVETDTMIASYLLDADAATHGMDALARRYLEHDTIKYRDVTTIGRGKQKGFDEVDVETARDYAAEDAHVTWLLAGILDKRLDGEGMRKLFHELEMPLVEVLVSMERHGMLVDPKHFAKLSEAMTRDLALLEKRICGEAGCDFNLNSPRQVAEVLFERLKLPTGKKTKTGYSTDVQVLESLAPLHIVAKLMLDYRALHKLKSTYVDTLPQLVNPNTGRLHTSFHQSVAATGRLSSSDPNLQNIPIRTNEGRRIREGFIAAPGHRLLAADYSQVELRILAHMSHDAAMRAAFLAGGDIHRATAAEIFGVAPDGVTPEMRRQAKAINFGIVYGMGAFRLANDLGISRTDAQAFINAYFERFAGVRAFIDRCVESARTKGYAETIMGRRRAIPQLRSGNRNEIAFGERLAVNSPIQGSAADIIKLAMIRLHAKIRDERLPMAMVLQVHDELVFEVKDEFVEQATSIAIDTMQNVVTLDVPLVVDARAAANWSEAH
ncbi:DNA polymerase I [bacterium]|nr:DNA polymerase I [bacterium]